MTIRVIRVIRARSFGRCAQMLARAALAVTTITTIFGTEANAQVDPSRSWQTIQTKHFYIHFTQEVEAQARRTAGNAERAYSQLSSQLTPPRGKIDIVLSDDVDFSNGSATPSPTNRIVLYASPPVSESALRFTDDWNAMVVTHELAHIFHLDRSRGIWALGQHIFGRSSALFPNLNSPSWLIEGLAVHYESYFTGAGRLKGSEHYIIARAAALDRQFPRLNQLSLANPRFPFGESAYSYGSLIVDRMANQGGPAKMREFVEKSSAQLVPFFPDLPAKEAFGKSFATSWSEWRDSIDKALPAQRDPIVGWRDLTRDNIVTASPRFSKGSESLKFAPANFNDSDPSVLLYSGTNGKESFRAHAVDLQGRRTQLGRRNSTTPNVRLPDGSILFAQIEFTGPYEERSDLWIERERHDWLTRLRLRSAHPQTRLTRNARVAIPDARESDGAIVAMQIVPAGTRLVRVARDGAITPITTGGIDEQWTEPRWSHRGDRIAAVRWQHGGNSAIVVMDTTGRILETVANGHSVQATPSWLPDDSALLYTSDRTGTPQIYLRRLAGASNLPGPELRVGDALTGLFEPQLGRGATPSDTTIAAVILRGDGYRLGVAPCCKATVDVTADIASTAGTPGTQATLAGAPTAAILIDSSRATRYSPWRTFWPRYWEPRVEDGLSFRNKDYRLGLQSSGRDVLGRHSYDFNFFAPTQNTGMVGGFVYQYAGLRRPIFQLAASQSWDHYAYIVSSTNSAILGELRRRTRAAEVTATWVKPGVRRAMSVTVGAGVERRAYASDPTPLLPALDTGHVFTSPPAVPLLVVSTGWSSVQRPTFSISPEDGTTFGVTARERTKAGPTGKGPASISVVGAATAYKSLDFPGFAHHVLALRGAAGFADVHSEGYFWGGGVSGTPIELVPGYTVGEGRQTFGVRGFPANSIAGVRALGGTVAYRVPLVRAGTGIARLPFYVDRMSLELFGEGAQTWCPSAAAGRLVCTSAALTQRTRIASVGGELDVTTAIFGWDDPYRLRVGYAVPVQNPVGARSSGTVYFAAGLSF